VQVEAFDAGTPQTLRMGKDCRANHGCGGIQVYRGAFRSPESKPEELAAG